MVAGFTGGFLTGIFATIDGCAAFGLTNPGGAIEGNGKQVWLQIVGALFIIGLNGFMTSLICLFIQYVLRIPLRMSDEHLMVGDDAVHGEEAYALFFEGERSHISLHGAGLESGHITEGQALPFTRPTSGHASPAEHSSSRDKEEVKMD